MVFSLSERMEKEGLQKNEVTCICLLTLCSHAGLVEKGQILFEAMSVRNRELFPHSCMVDLFGLAGRLDEAVLMMDLMPDAVAWSTVLGACQKWGNMELGMLAFDGVLRSDENESASFSLMSNIYSDAHLLKEDFRTIEQSKKSFIIMEGVS